MTGKTSTDYILVLFNSRWLPEHTEPKNTRMTNLVNFISTELKFGIAVAEAET